MIFLLVLCLIVIISGVNSIIDKTTMLPDGRIIRHVFSFFISFSLIGILYVLSVYAYLDFPIFIVILLLISSFFIVRFKFWKARLSFDSFNDLKKESILILIFLLWISIMFIKKAYKWGGWDSFAIWSQHARFLADRYYWKNYLTDQIAWCHPDYPLMLSSYIAVIWRSTVSISPVVPSFIAYVVLISIPLSVYSFFKSENKGIFGLLFFVLITIDRQFIELSTWLNADTLLSLFYLLSFLLYYSSSKNPSTLFLLGFFVGCCGWIKNEGNLFFIAFSFCLIFTKHNKPSHLLKYFAGSAIPLLMILSFKIFYSPVNDIVGGQSAGSVAKLMDIQRHFTVIKYFFYQLIVNYRTVLAAFILVLIFNKKYFRTFEFIVPAIVLAGYYLTYIVTPNDLKWHLETSCERLFHQLYPTVIFTILFGVSNNSIVLTKLNSIKPK